MIGTCGGIESDGVADATGGGLMPARLAIEYAQQMPGVGTLRFGFENLPIGMLGAVGLTAAMQRDRLGKCMRNVGHAKFLR